MALNEGDEAPNFEYEDSNGDKKQFHNLEGTKIVFFFPKAFTPGCTAQACSLRDNLTDLKSEGVVEVFGISIDNRETIMKFKEKHDLDYIMIADKEGSISKQYDVYNNFVLKKVSGRVTYTVSDNTITHVVDSGIRGQKVDNSLKLHGQDLLDLLKN